MLVRTEQEQSRETVDLFLRELQRPSKKLTSEELDFLERVEEYTARGGVLTQRDFKRLEAIWDGKVM